MDEEAPVVKQLEVEIESERARLAVSSAEHQTLLEAIEQQKQSKSQLESYLKQKEDLLKSLQAEKEKQRRLIVSNPQELRQMTVLLKDQLHSLKEDIAQDEQKSRDMLKKHALIKKDRYVLFPTVSILPLRICCRLTLARYM